MDKLKSTGGSGELLKPGMRKTDIQKITRKNIGKALGVSPETKELSEQRINIYRKDGWVICSWPLGRKKNYVFISPKYIGGNHEVSWGQGTHVKRTMMKIGDKNKFIARCAQGTIKYESFGDVCSETS